MEAARRNRPAHRRIGTRSPWSITSPTASAPRRIRSGSPVSAASSTRSPRTSLRRSRSSRYEDLSTAQAQERPKATHAVQHYATTGVGEEISRTALSVDIRASRVFVVVESHRNTSEGQYGPHAESSRLVHSSPLPRSGFRIVVRRRSVCPRPNSRNTDSFKSKIN